MWNQSYLLEWFADVISDLPVSAVMEVGTVTNSLPWVWGTTTVDSVTVSLSLSASRCYNNKTPRGQKAIWMKQTQTPTFSFFRKDKGINAHSWIPILRNILWVWGASTDDHIGTSHCGSPCVPGALWKSWQCTHCSIGHSSNVCSKTLVLLKRPDLFYFPQQLSGILQAVFLHCTV